MTEIDNDMKIKRNWDKSKDNFIRWVGIGPELAEFVNEYIEKPENFISMTFDERCKIENQMDAVLSSFVKR